MDYEFTVKNCLLDLDCTDRRIVIEKMIQRLNTNGEILNPDLVLKAVLAREDIRGTGLARGIACPHGRVEGIKGVHVAVARLKNPVDFGAVDEVPAKHVFLILTDKSEHTAQHLAMMSEVVKCYQFPGVIKLLDDAPDVETYVGHLQACHDS